MSCVPAKNWWLTCSEVLALARAGLMTHQLLPRVWLVLFRSGISPALPGIQTIGIKLCGPKSTGLFFLCLGHTALKSGVTSVGAMHVHHLLQGLQKKDMEGGMLMLLLLSGSKSPVRQCLVDYTDMLMTPLTSSGSGPAVSSPTSARDASAPPHTVRAFAQVATSKPQ